MKRSHILFTGLTCALLLFLSACSSDDGNNTGLPPGTENPDPDGSGGEEIPLVEGLTVYKPSKFYDGYTLVNDAAANRVYLMDKKTSVVFEWNMDGKRLGNDAHLMENGKILAMLEAEDPQIQIGGFGGMLAILDKDGAIEWSYVQSDENQIAHHDLEMLPNGNIIFMSWQKRPEEEATAAGYSGGTPVIYDAVYEIDPTTDQIVWEWHMWDHLIQDFDPARANYGVIAEHPERIDFNYFQGGEIPGDISHANGIAYDAENDLIYISANFYSEMWVIDHSTTTEEARGSTGGNFGRGGDLVYRFGNPEAYDNPQGTRLFDRNHHPNLLSGEKKGNMLVFANGLSIEQSTAYELKLPGQPTLLANADNEPEVVWSFTDPTLFSGRVSGVVLLPNGNRLITEGDFGFWEVTEDGEVVWKFQTNGFFWRGYHYDKDGLAIQALGLQP